MRLDVFRRRGMMGLVGVRFYARAYVVGGWRKLLPGKRFEIFVICFEWGGLRIHLSQSL